MNNLQKWGGIAALGHAAAYLVGLALGVTLMFPILNAAPEQYLKFLADNQALVYLWNLISYWGSAITLVVMVLALYERLKGRSPALMQTATVFGLIWAGLIIASGNLMLHNGGVVAELYAPKSGAGRDGVDGAPSRWKSASPAGTSWSAACGCCC